MKTIVHISDLHFGKEKKEVVEALSTSIEKQKPDLIAVSGDLTQRAFPSQFNSAVSFLDSFDCPKVIVPGNHDIPVYNIIERLADPFKRFCHLVCCEDYPCHEDDEIAVLGVNSVENRTWKSGRLINAQIDRIEQLFNQIDDKLLKILVIHHNLIFFPFEKSEKKVLSSTRILNRLITSSVDVILLGHDHRSMVVGLPQSRTRPPKAILVKAGTAVSTRTRGEVNSYNVLILDGGDFKVTVRYFQDGIFIDHASFSFQRKRDEWI
jgi:3',5'-cyclic AMP phosphodiesterase CpdA